MVVVVFCLHITAYLVRALTDDDCYTDEEHEEDKERENEK